MTNPIQLLLRDPQPALILDMGLGSREQSMPSARPAPVRFILSEQAPGADRAQPCPQATSPL